MPEFDTIVYFDENGERPIWTCPMKSDCGYIVENYYCAMKTLVEYFDTGKTTIGLKFIACDWWREMVLPYD